MLKLATTQDPSGDSVRSWERARCQATTFGIRGDDVLESSNALLERVTPCVGVGEGVFARTVGADITC